MRVLVTRAPDDAGLLAEALVALGFEPVLEPLLNIRFSDDGSPDLTGLQAIAFTSANGVRALAHGALDAKKLGLPVFAVGAATAAAARAAGFDGVTSADGDVAALARLIIARTSPDNGAVLQVAGSHLAGDLAGTLEAAGIMIRRIVLYEAVAAESLSDSTRKMIEAGGIGAVLIFSPRTARLFVSLMEDAGLEDAARGMILVALSRAVAEAAASLSWAAVRIAETPDSDALIQALGHGAGGD
jgi:uroporphyrinogen-III synthase